MVGLSELGEIGWKVEQVGNRLIEEERPVTQAVLTMIDVAEKSFRGWVDELSNTHRIAPDAHALLTAIHAVQREWPGGAKIPPPVRNEIKADIAAPASPLPGELAVLRFAAGVPPGGGGGRGGHPRAGIHRPGGSPPIASTANALEQTLIALAQRGAALPTIAQPVLARAIDGIAHLVGRVRARADFSVADVAEVTDIQRDLETLRRDAVGAGAGDAETAAAEVARREEET